MNSQTSFLRYFGMLCLIWVDTADGVTKCRRDKDLADYPVNVYYCEDDGKPECCELNKEFTCCAKDIDKNSNEQLKLWGLVGIVVVIAAFVLVCWRKDTYLCEGPTLKDRCVTCCRCGSTDEKEPELSDTHKPEMQSVSPARTNYDDNHFRRDDGPLTARQVAPSFNDCNQRYDWSHRSKHDMHNMDDDEERFDSGHGSTVSLERTQQNFQMYELDGINELTGRRSKGKVSPFGGARPKNDRTEF